MVPVHSHAENFNPRSPHRERLGARCNLRRYLDFNPRSPHRERRVHFPDFAFWLQFQSTLPSQGATDEKFGEFLNNFISIHAPLTGSDTAGLGKCRQTANISIHAPLTGSDSQREGVKVTVTVFQSTLPSQGATVVDAFMRMAFGDFNPRSPHRERRWNRWGWIST